MYTQETIFHIVDQQVNTCRTLSHRHAPLSLPGDVTFAIEPLAPVGRALYMRDLFMSTDDTRLKKLRFRAWRRGFREADLILGPFADKHVQDFDEGQLDLFERLLEVPDQDLYAWIVGTLPPDPAFDGELLNSIKAFAAEAGAVAGGPRGG